jgi:hypothetical protein
MKFQGIGYIIFIVNAYQMSHIGSIMKGINYEYQEYALLILRKDVRLRNLQHEEKG